MKKSSWKWESSIKKKKKKKKKERFDTKIIFLLEVEVVRRIRAQVGQKGNAKGHNSWPNTIQVKLEDS